MKNKPIRYSLIAVMVLVLIFSFKVYNDNKEKSLVDLVNYNSSSFKSFTFAIKGSFAWKEDKKEPAEKLMKFLNQYQVKKDAKCGTDQSKGFEFTMGSKDKTEKLVTINEKCTYISGSGLYKVVNGPIDMDWVQKFNEEYQQ